MKKQNLTKRLKASAMSMVIAASAVPAYMLSMPAYAAISPTVAVSTKTADLLEMKVDSVYSEALTKYADTGLKSITFTVISDYDTSFSYGFGISVEKSDDAPKYWIEHNADGGWDTKGAGYSVSLKAGVATDITIDLSDLDITYTSDSKYEFRCYYSAHWDNSVKDMVDDTTTLQAVSVNGSSTTTDPSTDPSKDPTDDPSDNPGEESRENVVPKNNKQTNGDNWSFVDNGDGTATISSTVARQLSDLDITLTKGYDEDYYALNPSDDENKPINSHKFLYTDFGITDMSGVTIESITCIIEPDVEMDQFVYGGGLNVEHQSPADTEYAKQVAGVEGKEDAGYWYNDMGLEGDSSVAYFEEMGVVFEITPGNGAKLFDAGSYIEAYWEVPAEVQPYTGGSLSDTISFQYWWGNDTEGEEVESVKLTEAILTYTKTVTVPYTDSVANAVKETITHTGTESQKNLEVSYSDLGLDETMDVYAVRFDITANSDIGKFIYNVGTGVDETVSSDYWFQEDTNFVVLEAGSSAQIMWIVPTKAAGDSEKANGVNTKDGKLQIGYYYGEADSITIDNIEVYYDVPETTTEATTTTTTTTEAPTTTTTTTTEEVTTTTTEEQLKVTRWGDANVDGFVTLADVVAVLQSIANQEKYPLSAQGALNADVYNNGDGVTGLDALTIQQVDAGTVKEADLPVKG